MSKMFKVRFAPRGEKPCIVRYPTMEMAHKAVANCEHAHYVGPVYVYQDAQGEWREQKNKRREGK